MANKLFKNFLFILLTFIIPLVLSDVDHWSYSSQHEWPKLCKTGGKQSPIDINTKSVSINTSLFIDIKHYEFEFHNFKISNNGHTAQLVLDYSGDETKPQPFITGLALNNEVYLMAQLHFHWSDHKGRGSEHAFNGRTYSMEMHIVHFNKKYDNISESMHHKDGLAVIGVMFEITRKENPHLDAIIEGVRAVKIEGTEDFHSSPQFRQNPIQPTIRLENLLPNDLTLFFRYKGSLTTPPCYEAVTWLVFHDTTDIGLKQIQSFRELMNSEKVVMSDTFRQLQALNERRVEASRRLSDPMTGAATHVDRNHLLTHLSLIVSSLLIITKY